MDLRNIRASEIMSTDITTISPDEKISRAELLMIKKNVGGLPVVNKQNELIGIITHRDINLSRFSVFGGDNNFHVDDLMSKDPICCHVDDKLQVIVKKMVEHDIERIPIVDDKKHVVGIVVTIDIISALANVLD